MDFRAIIKAYPDAAYIDETVVKDKSGNVITIDQSLVDAARVELDKLNYQSDRTINGSTTYAPTGEQLAMIYDDIIAGKLDSTGSFVAHNKAVKDANPKPS
tara:strand:- start:18 stop:320 length:303 start_codon:yes stop_codon:yes gene_type:complete